MKKKVLFLFLSVITLFTLTACDKDEDIEIALVTDVGNIDDKSFNEGAWKGVVKYATEFNKTYAYYRPSEDSKASRVETMEQAISKGAKLVVCPGFLFEEAIYEIQNDYPNVSFLLLDGEPRNADGISSISKNVHCIYYNEEQAGYLAGYGAVMDGYRKLGFLGGIAIPAVMRFGWGYIQGANDAAKKLELENDMISMQYNYAGAFISSPELTTKMTGWYTAGTEVVFACGGAIYLSVTQAAEAANRKVIGVDVDQVAESKTIITSAMKELTNSVVLALKAFYNNGGKWTNEQAGKAMVLGAKDDCIGLPTNEASWRFNTFKVADYTTLFNQIKNGTIKVSDDITTVQNSNEFANFKSMITHVSVNFSA